MKNKILSKIFLETSSVILMYLASLFLGLQIYEYLNYPISAQATTITNRIDIINNDTLLGIISLLTVFAGLLSYIFYKIVKRDIHNDIKKDYGIERNLSKAEAAILVGFHHMHLYKTLYEGKNQSMDNNGKAFKQICFALSHIKRAIEFLKEVEDKKCLRQIFLTKNNLAYYLARKWNYYRDIKNTQQDKTEIDSFFKNYLEENDERAKEYNGDKRVAEGCVKYLKQICASEVYPDLSTSLEDTFEWVEEIFSVKAEIRRLS